MLPKANVLKSIFGLLVGIVFMSMLNPVDVYANGVTDAIQKVVDVYPNSCAYFTSDGKSDSSNSDSRCSLVNIPSRGGLPSGKTVYDAYGKTNCWSCHAFAEYAWYVIFGHCTNTQTITVSPSELRVGDFIRFSGHSAIYLGEDQSNYYVYDSNWASPADNKVRYNHAISKSRGIENCYRATNYDVIANQPKPYDSYGFDNPSNNEVITEGTFLFQGWIEAKKEIISITCSINHGAHYVETALYKRPDVPAATAFRAEVDSNILNIGNNDVALCVNFTDGTGIVVENRTVTWSPKLLWGYDSPTENMQISDNQFQFSGWIETSRKLERITCSLNGGEQYITANLYKRPDVPNAIAFRADIMTADLHYGDNYVAVCAHYADGTGEPIVMRKVRKCIIDAMEFPQNNEKFTCNNSWFLLQGWSTDDNKAIGHFEFLINETRHITVAYTRPDLLENARYYREEIPLNWLKNGKNGIEIFAYYTDGTSRSIGQVEVFGELDHKWDEGKVTQVATCTENGIKSYMCTECQTTRTEEIPATGHQYQNGLCTVCDEKDPNANVAQGNCGNTVTWSLNQNGLLTISGSGTMKNYDGKTAVPWYSYRDQIHAVTVENGVTSISDYAFYGLLNLTEVQLSDTVAKIGDYAFKSCTALQEVQLPAALTQLGESSFYGCTALKSIDIPDTLYTVKPYTFKNCTSLESVTFHEGNLQKLSDAAFYGTALTEVTIPDCATIVDSYCFKNCTKLASIHLSSNMTEIREAAFYGTAVVNLEIPEGIKKIGPYAFKNCTRLTGLNLPSTITNVGEASFYACTALKAVTLPDAVTSIGNYAFRKCEKLDELNLSANLEVIGESSFYGCTNLRRLDVPDKVKSIGGYAFKSCTGLEFVFLPDSLETLGESAFYGCTDLTEITIPQNVCVLGEYVFSRCTGLKSIYFTGDAPSIGTGAFTKVTATAIYPNGNATWTGSVKQNYGGIINWIEENHAYNLQLDGDIKIEEVETEENVPDVTESVTEPEENDFGTVDVENAVEESKSDTLEITTESGEIDSEVTENTVETEEKDSEVINVKNEFEDSISEIVDTIE